VLFANPRETNIQLFRALTPLAVMQSTDKGQLDAKGSAIRNGRWSGVTRKQRCASSRYLCRRQYIYSARRQPRPVEPTIASCLPRLCAAKARRDMDPPAAVSVPIASPSRTAASLQPTTVRLRSLSSATEIFRCYVGCLIRVMQQRIRLAIRAHSAHAAVDPQKVSIAFHSDLINLE